MFQTLHRRFLSADVAIDLGTANTLVVERGAGVVFDEPSICCFKVDGGEPALVAAGLGARRLVGRVAKPLNIIHPLLNGVLSDISAARELLKYAVRSQSRSWRLTRPRALIGVPADATKAERSALITAASDAGLARPELLDEPLLSAIGIGLDVDAPRGRMIIDCGAGTTEIVVISLGRICLSHSVRGGGEALDRALIDHFHAKHRFDIGASTAEELKIRLSSLIDGGAGGGPLEVRGLDATDGVPKVLTIAAAELLPVWTKSLEGILAALRVALSETPPELSHDILEDGISLTGGAAMTGLLAQSIVAQTGIAVNVADTPLRSVANGLGKLLERRCGH